MSANDSRWLVRVFGPLVAYWIGWVALMPGSGVAFRRLPAVEQAYVLGLVPVVLWALAAAVGVVPLPERGERDVPDLVRS